MTGESTGARIASVAELPADGTFLFRVEPVGSDVAVEREAILMRTIDGGDEEGGVDEDGNERSGERDGDGGEDDGVAAWLNYCQHITHVKLDKGGGAPVRTGEILCTNHGAMFEVDTGLCTHGPCEGAYLNELDVKVEAGEVCLDDPEYAFVGLGEIDWEIGDLSSTSNVEF